MFHVVLVKKSWVSYSLTHNEIKFVFATEFLNLPNILRAVIELDECFILSDAGKLVCFFHKKPLIRNCRLNF